MILLYGRFRSLIDLLEKDKLQAPNLELTNCDYSFFVDPILISLIGDEQLVKTQTFDLIEKYQQNHEAINQKLKELFGKRVEFDFLAFKNSGSFFKMVDTKEFYHANSIYFSKKPLTKYSSFLSIEVPDELVRNSPEKYPVVPGELALNKSVQFYAKNPSIIRYSLNSCEKRYLVKRI